MTTRRANMNHANRTSPVLGLFLAGGPATVLRRVWAIVVDAFDAVFRRGLDAHVSLKRLEVVPSRIECNPPRSVVLEVDAGWVPASALDATPNVVELRSGLPVSEMTIPGGFDPEASATFGVSGDERSILDTQGSPAIAPAFPYRSWAFVLSPLDHSQSSEFQACSI